MASSRRRDCDELLHEACGRVGVASGNQGLARRDNNGRGSDNCSYFWSAGSFGSETTRSRPVKSVGALNPRVDSMVRQAKKMEVWGCTSCLILPWCAGGNNCDFTGQWTQSASMTLAQKHRCNTGKRFLARSEKIYLDELNGLGRKAERVIVAVTKIPIIHF